ncbi:MAG: hypothetical protein KBC46_05180 [Ferrovibrio sp.]|nr:hypothetical protein [Ferrovibrio sp.]
MQSVVYPSTQSKAYQILDDTSEPAIASIAQGGSQQHKEIETKPLVDSVVENSPISFKTTVGNRAPNALHEKENTKNSKLSEKIASALLLEGLVLEELQNEFRGAVTKNVQIVNSQGRPFHIDGIVRTNTDTFLVEIKMLTIQPSHINGSLARMRKIIENAKSQINLLLSTVEKAEEKNIKGLIAVVYDGPKDKMYEADLLLRENFEYSRFITRVYYLPDLLKKYGLQCEDPERLL